MINDLWVSDRDPGLRTLLQELVPEAEAVTPSELEARLAAGQLPQALVIDGTQLLELPARHRRAVLGLPRLLICTGLPLPSLPMSLISGPAVAVLAKPFCVEDLEVAAEWLRGYHAGSAPAQAVRGGAAPRSTASLPVA
jgi:hypothetical protein